MFLVLVRVPDALKFSEMFLLLAAGKIKSALIKSIPTHFIESITRSAIKTAKASSITLTEILLLFANVAWILIAVSLLMLMHQKTKITTNKTIS